MNNPVYLDMGLVSNQEVDVFFFVKPLRVSYWNEGTEEKGTVFYTGC